MKERFFILCVLSALALLAGCEAAPGPEGAQEAAGTAFTDGSRGFGSGAPVRLALEAPAWPLPEGDCGSMSVFVDGESVDVAGSFAALSVRAGVYPDGGKPLAGDTRVFLRKVELCGPFWKRGALLLFPDGLSLWEHPCDEGGSVTDDLFFTPGAESGDRPSYVFDEYAGISGNLLWGGEGLPSGKSADVFGEGGRLFLIPFGAESGQGTVRVVYDVAYGKDFSSPGSCTYTTNTETFPLEGNFDEGDVDTLDIRIVLHPVSMTGGVSGWEPVRGGV